MENYISRSFFGILLFVCCLSDVAYSQFNWGLKFGYSNNHLFEQQSDSALFPGKNALFLGAVLRKKMYDQVSFQLEVLYQPKGEKATFGESEEMITFNNLVITLSGRPHWDMRFFDLYVGAGIYGGAALSGGLTFPKISNAQPFQIYEHFQPWDLGWIVDIGIEWTFQRGALQIGWRHDHGLRKMLLDEFSSGSLIRGSGLPRTFSLSITYLSQ